MNALGLDACKSGWFYIALSKESFDFGVVTKAEQLLAISSPSTRLFIDIPIGLTNTARQCDIEARKRLGKRKSSVFPSPSRAALNASSYEDANQKNVAASGKKLSKQSYAIMPKIKEIDQLIQSKPLAKTIIKEVHPELCFWALNKEIPLEHYKKTTAGFQERLNILKHYDLNAEANIARAFLHSSSLGVARDDVVDAFVNALTASFPDALLRKLPETTNYDEYGIAMQMLYAAGEY